MNNLLNYISIQTKKACRSRHFLAEVASYKVIFFSYAINCLITPRILRGNTKALYKLLLHTSTNIIYALRPVCKQKSMSYPQP